MSDEARRLLSIVRESLISLERGRVLLMDPLADRAQINEVQTAKAYLDAAVRELEAD